jgi:hypothetical protein
MSLNHRLNIPLLDKAHHPGIPDPEAKCNTGSRSYLLKTLGKLTSDNAFTKAVVTDTGLQVPCSAPDIS